MKSEIKKYHLTIIVILMACTITSCKSLVNKFAFHPDNINIIPAETLPPGIQELNVKTKDGISLTSLYLPSEGSDRVLIYFHGNAGNIYQRIPTLQQLHKTGINVIGVSYRGYGKSEGEVSEQGIYIDGKTVFNYVQEKMGFSVKKTIIMGRSIGTTVAINIAQNTAVSGLILVTPLTNGNAQSKAMGLGLMSSFAGNSFDNLSKINNVISPLLVIHGTDDKFIPYTMGQHIFNTAKTQKQFISIEGGRHNNLDYDYAPQYWRPIIEFIKTTAANSI